MAITYKCKCALMHAYEMKIVMCRHALCVLRSQYSAMWFSMWFSIPVTHRMLPIHTWDAHAYESQQYNYTKSWKTRKTFSKSNTKTSILVNIDTSR